MFNRTRRFAILAVVALVGATASADDGPSAATARDRAREGVRLLAADVEHLQDALVDDGVGADNRAAYRKLDAARERLESLETALRAGTKPSDLSAKYDEVDRQLGEVVDGLASSAGAKGPLVRAARYVQAARDQLDCLLVACDPSPARTRRAIGRQARALAAATADLHRTAEFALDESPARDTLRASLQSLRAASDEFARQAARGEAGADLKEAFDPVATAWTKVLQSVRRLPPASVASFARAATRVDQIHARLYRLLDIKGERPRIAVRT